MEKFLEYIVNDLRNIFLLNSESRPHSDEPPGEMSENISIIVDEGDCLKYTFKTQKIESYAEKVLEIFSLEQFELSIKFVNKADIQTLNSDYRQKDTPTDVLSFNQTDFSPPISIDQKPKCNMTHNILGDIVICVEIAETNASSIGHDLGDEIAFLIVHGVLHLGGHDHENQEEEKLMMSQQRAAIQMIKNNLPANFVSDLVIRATPTSIEGFS